MNLKQVNIELDELVDAKSYQKAKYIFLWNDNNKTLTDDYHKITKIYGYKAERTIISVENGTLTMIMKGYGPILKTSNDSIDIGRNCTKAKGYMGIFTNSNEFFISEDGQVHIVNAIPCK